MVLDPGLLSGHFLTVHSFLSPYRAAMERDRAALHAGCDVQKEGTEEGKELVVYLKYGFVVEGLMDVLTCPGLTVLLKDVARQGQILSQP